MKEYPSIPKFGPNGLHYYFFDKLDGSNIRAEWTRKHGAFFKFGSRTQLLGSDYPTLGVAIELIKQKYEAELNQRLRALQVPKAICFFEFYGPGSFAGNHVVSDPKTVTLFDISVHPRGILSPKAFLELTEGLDTPALLHSGPMSEELVQAVLGGTLPGMTFEGVVAKANQGTPGLPHMFKLKNRAWLDKLRNFCNNDAALFARLA